MGRVKAYTSQAKPFKPANETSPYLTKGEA
jgi:hypothetical protein